MDFDHDFLTVGELAEKLKVPKSWIYSRTRESGPNTMPTIRCGKYLRFDFSIVMKWLEKKYGETADKNASHKRV